MKKNVIELNNILANLKGLTATHDREYIRQVWAITNHVAIQSSKGREHEIEIMTDLHDFISKLNKKYPISNEDIGFDSYLIP